MQDQRRDRIDTSGLVTSWHHVGGYREQTRAEARLGDLDAVLADGLRLGGAGRDVDAQRLGDLVLAAVPLPARRVVVLRRSACTGFVRSACAVVAIMLDTGTRRVHRAMCVAAEVHHICRMQSQKNTLRCRPGRYCCQASVMQSLQSAPEQRCDNPAIVSQYRLCQQTAHSVQPDVAALRSALDLRPEAIRQFTTCVSAEVSAVLGKHAAPHMCHVSAAGCTTMVAPSIVCTSCAFCQAAILTCE